MRPTGGLNASVGELQIGGFDLVVGHQGGRELLHLGAGLLGGLQQRGPAYGLRAAPEGPHALLYHPGVAVQDGDVLDRNREMVGQHLRERGLVALAVGSRSGGGADLPAALDRHRRVLPAAGPSGGRGTTAADLDETGQAHADDAAFGAGGVAFGHQRVPPGNLKRPLQV